MIGKRKSQQALFDVGNVFDLSLPASSYHAQLAQAAPYLFKDDDFAAFYSSRMGRPSVPPSQLALLVILQSHANCSSEEAIARSAYDARWAAVLRRPLGEPLCARSTLEVFLAHLEIHQGARQILASSLAEARRCGLLSGRALRTALDTKPILGRGAAEDTYNLLASGIRLLATVLARRQKRPLPEWYSSNDLCRYLAPSIKGTVMIDWSDQEATDQFLTSIVADARRVLAMAEPYLKAGDAGVKDAASLLCQILLQDVAETTDEDGSLTATIKEGTAPGRIPSATDPEQRHGRKSRTKRFNGHKAAVATDMDTGLITATKVIAGDAPDSTGAVDLVEQSEENTGLPVTQTIGDCAYGGGQTRQDFADAGRTLYAKVPTEWSRNGVYPKSAFAIDLSKLTVTCPGGQTTDHHTQLADGSMTFFFGQACTGCPLREHCTTAKDGRTLHVHAQEQLLREARAYQKTPEGRAHLKDRLVVENSLGRLAQLGIGQARRNGRAKTAVQLAIAAAVANLRRTWNWQQKQTNIQNNNGSGQPIGQNDRSENVVGLLKASHSVYAAVKMRFQTSTTAFWTSRCHDVAFAA
jgi:hypothetical protein